MTSTKAETTVTTQVYRVYIKATPEAVWDAITKPEFTERYAYTRAEFDLRPGGVARSFATPQMKKEGAELGFDIPDLLTDGEVIEADRQRRLVHTWRLLWDEDTAAQGFTRITWELESIQEGVTTLTVVHDLEGAPRLAAIVSGSMEDQGTGGGWAELLSSMKTLLETGETLR
jgi:uncharacterized protein YndB with AHSA1/START domain